MSEFLDYPGLQHYHEKIDNKKADLETVDGLSSDYSAHYAWYIVSWSDGAFSVSGGTYDSYVISNIGFRKVSATLGHSTNSICAVAFYSTEKPTTEGFMKTYSVRASSSKTLYEADVPDGCKLIVVVNRNSYQASPAISLTMNPSSLTIESKSRLIKIDGLTASFMETEKGYINWSDGKKVASNNLDIYKFRNVGIGKIKVTVGCNDRTPAAIAFYSTDEISADGFLQSDSERMTNTISDFESLVPNGCKLIVVTNRSSVDASPVITLYSTLNAYAAGLLSGVGGVVTNLNGLKAEANKEFLFGGPSYAHLFIDDITRNSTPVIPSQSLEDVRIAARLGFKYIEANVQTTSDGVLIAMHGDSGNFGYEVEDINGEFTYADTAIDSVTYEWITQNIRYRSTIAKLKTTIPTLEQFLNECKINGISVMMTYSTAAYALAKKYFGDNWIAYQGNRNAGFSGFIMQYSSLATKAEILAECDAKKPPYIHMLTSAAFNTFNNANTLADLAQAVHEKGCLLGLASCYQTTAETVAFFAAGGDVTASESEVNYMESGNVCNISDDNTFDSFATTGTVMNRELVLESGQTVSSPLFDNIYLGKGEIYIKFNGTLIIRSFGYKKNTDATITSDGFTSVRISTYFLNQAPTFALEASAATTISSLRYKASKC